MDERSQALIRQAWPRQVIFILILALMLFAPAGTLSYWQGWLFLCVFVASSIALGIYFLRHDPALIERRIAAGPRAEQEPAQKIIAALLFGGFIVLLLLPGLDRRWQWSALPAWLILLANAGVIVSFVVFFFVMKQNSYAASTIRVEEQQPLVSTGLYGIVRHPMYAGALLLAVCTPLALGSYWSLLLLIALVPVLAWRLVDEERFLARNLPGYAEYRRRIRYRLVPGVW